MNNFFLSPNMNLVIPTVNQEPGPNWADDLNASLLTVDSHNHASGSGVQVTPLGININSDLSFNTTNNAISLRSVRFTPQSVALSGAADLGCLYEAGVDLYYNDGAGNQVRITQSGNVAGSSGTITGLPSGTASASYQSGSGTFQFQQATSTGANLDVASIAIRYPGSYPTPSGNYIQIQAPSSLSSGYALTLPSLPAQTNVMALGTSGTISSITYDQVGQGMTSVGANAIQAVTTRTVINTAPQGGVMVTASSGQFDSSASGFTAVTGITGSLVTSGRPVMLSLQTDGSTSGVGSYIGYFIGSGVGTSNVYYQFYRNGSPLGFSAFYILNTSSLWAVPPHSISMIDFPGAGTWNYTMQIAAFGGGSGRVYNCAMVAYEI